MTSSEHWNLPQDSEELIRNLDCQDWATSLSEDELEIIWQAYVFAREAHKGQERESGEPYVFHSLSVAKILAKYHLDAEAVAGALLHDVIEDTSVSLEAIKQRFGSEVAALVDGVSKLKLREYSPEQQDAESLRKLFLAMISDARVVLIKLADRLHNVRTLSALPEHRRQKIAGETLDIFAPLAERIGIWEIRAELEDLSFRYLDPEVYNKIAAEVQRIQEEHQETLARIIERVRVLLLEADLPADQFTITGRPKNIYSIYKKMHTPKYDGRGVERIYDKLGVRIIVNTIPECYTVLGIAHSKWPPIPGEFDDYIGMPLPSGYQSLHTAVRYGPRKHDVVEFQIRTHQMHYEAEYGIASHWLYKEKGKHDVALQKKVAWLRRLLEGPQESEDAETFVQAIKAEVFQDRVYAFTPKGKLIDLPVNATPIDFAYQVHTEIGHRCRGARVNGKLVSLDYQLRSGDQIEILTARRGGPSRDWLNPALGLIKTSRARTKIRQWFRRQDRQQNIAQGREIVERELKRLGVERLGHEAVAQLFSYEELGDFYAAVGFGDIHSQQIAGKIAATRPREEVEFPLAPPPPVPTVEGIQVQGTGGLLNRLARCCNPLPGDDIIGYVTRGRGVTVHRRDCPNILRLEDTERLIEVSWGTRVQTVPATIHITAYDRARLLSEISNIIGAEDINISAVKQDTRKNVATIYITIEVNSMAQLSRVLTKIERLPNVIEARRHTG